MLLTNVAAPKDLPPSPGVGANENPVKLYVVKSYGGTGVGVKLNGFSSSYVKLYGGGSTGGSGGAVKLNGVKPNGLKLKDPYVYSISVPTVTTEFSEID